MAYLQPLPVNITKNGKLPPRTHFSSRHATY